MNTNAKPRLTVASEPQPTGLAATTYESRKGMTPAQLIVLMGEKHVSHPQYKPRPFTLIPMPNLAGREGLHVIERTDYGIVAEFRRLIRWAAQ